MNILTKTICTASVVLSCIVSIPALSKPSTHKIGFVKIAKYELSQTGVCGYWLIGSKDRDKVVLVRGVTEKPLMNIDGENIALKLVSQKRVRRNKKIFGSINKYESTGFKVMTEIRDVTTLKDRKEFVTRERGSVIITSNDGWQKQIEVECAYDSGG
jgi:hypothetical protein